MMVDIEPNNIPLPLQHIVDNLFNQLNQAETENQQAEIKTHIMKEIVETTQLTSAYICRWFPETSQSLIAVEYISDQANPLERKSDLGEFTKEEVSSFIGRWLIMGDSSPDSANVFNLALDDTDRQRFLQYGACSICIARIKTGTVLWGYLEMWESRYERDFTQEELSIFHYVATKFGNFFASSS